MPMKQVLTAAVVLLSVCPASAQQWCANCPQYPVQTWSTMGTTNTIVGVEPRKTGNAEIDKAYGICEQHISSLSGGGSDGDAILKKWQDDWQKPCQDIASSREKILTENDTISVKKAIEERKARDAPDLAFVNRVAKEQKP